MERFDAKDVGIYNWSQKRADTLRSSKFGVLDTTLRDGAQTEGRQLSLAHKLMIIDADFRVGFEKVDLCMPSRPNGTWFKDGVICAQYMRDKYPSMRPVMLVRTTRQDVDGAKLFAKLSGVKPDLILFRGSSDLRILAEGWEKERMVAEMFRFTKELAEEGFNVVCATEDTTRTKPEFLKQIFEAGKLGGATEFCVADTVGYADAEGVKEQIEWIQNEIVGQSGIEIQYHGHDDTQEAVPNTAQAVISGARTAHVTWLGVGERAGNASVEGFLSYLQTRDACKYDLTQVPFGSITTAVAFGEKIHKRHPLSGGAVFTTRTGGHAEGIYRAYELGLGELAGIVYSAVAPEAVGRTQTMKISHSSGRSNVRWVLKGMDIEFCDKLADLLLAQAGEKDADLTDGEILATVNDFYASLKS